MSVVRACIQIVSASEQSYSNVFRKYATTTAHAKVGKERRRRHFAPGDVVTVGSSNFVADEVTNISPKLLQLTGRNLWRQRGNPLRLIAMKIEHYFNQNYRQSMGHNRSPLFSLHDHFSPAVSVWSNFDSLLVPADHVSRSPRDTYYINRDQVLRAHTSAHQRELLAAGRDQFLVLGDVYRRDTVDRMHYPVFHQLEGVRLYTAAQLFHPCMDPSSMGLHMFNHSLPSDPLDAAAWKDDFTCAGPQPCHSADAAGILEHSLKDCLQGLVRALFGEHVKTRWVSTVFPFTRPSWELEVLMDDRTWMEALGCGIVQQRLLSAAGVSNRVGWAFGLGLERLAMRLYSIPDIRLFWSDDPSFLVQFDTDDFQKRITYQAPKSGTPACINDLSFWLPGDGSFSPSEVFETARSFGDDTIERVELIDDFVHPKTQRRSQCYRFVYRHTTRPLEQSEVSAIHGRIARALEEQHGCEIR